jgi:hypothetical protein
VDSHVIRDIQASDHEGVVSELVVN